MQFHFDQSKVRSEIRLREGRTKPIDILLKNLSFSDEFDVELNEPYLVFKVSNGSLSLSNSSVMYFEHHHLSTIRKNREIGAPCIIFWMGFKISNSTHPYLHCTTCYI
jgi:hypothetical protein